MWNIVTKNSPGSCCNASWVTKVDFSAPFGHIVGQVGRGALQRDTVI